MIWVSSRFGHHHLIIPSFRFGARLCQGQKNIAGILTAKPKESTYRATDLHIGSYVRIFEREMFLHDMDEFTRNYYRKVHGYSEDMLAPINVQASRMHPTNNHRKNNN